MKEERCWRNDNGHGILDPFLKYNYIRFICIVFDISISHLKMDALAVLCDNTHTHYQWNLRPQHGLKPSKRKGSCCIVVLPSEATTWGIKQKKTITTSTNIFCSPSYLFIVSLGPSWYSIHFSYSCGANSICMFCTTKNKRSLYKNLKTDAFRYRMKKSWTTLNWNRHILLVK